MVVGLLLLSLMCFIAGMLAMYLVSQVPELRTPPRLAQTNPTAKATATLTSQQGEQLLMDITRILKDEYIDPESIDTTRMYYGAAAGLVSSLGDIHTMFVEPIAAGYEAERMEGSFEGIGATVEVRDGDLTIVRTIPGSPALRAGLQPGDVIELVDGTPTKGLTVTEGVTLIRGPRGTSVKLTIRRESTAEKFDVTVTRDRIELPAVTYKMLDGKVAYIQLTVFNAVATKQVRAAIKELLAQEPVGMILDLRGNPGGYLQTAVEIASQFLPRNTLVLTEVKRDADPREFRVRQAGEATTIELAVLVDGGSASASEIVAGAIQDAGRGMIIGTKTYGKGSVQATHDMINGSSLRVTIAKWNRPSGANLDGNGIDPDLIVEFTQEDAEAERDPQLDAAIKVLTE